MKNTYQVIAITLMVTLAIAQPMPSTGTIVAGKVTFHGERVDSAVVEIKVPGKEYRIRSTFLHEELNYYISSVKAASGDYITVTAFYEGMNSSNYAIKGSEQSYIINIEVTDKSRLPPANMKETPSSAVSSTSISSTTTTEAVHDSTASSSTTSINEEEGDGFYKTIAIVAAAIVLVLFIYGVISRRS